MRYPFVELGTGAAFALVAWWWSSSVSDYGQTGAEAAAWWLALGGYLGFAAAGIVLTLIDLHHQRLPDIIVLPGLVVVLSLFSASALLWGEWSRLGSTLGAAIALFVLYFVIALVYPRGIGGGDVKLAPLVGATLGFVGWGAVVVGTFAGFLLGAAFGLVLIALRRATRKSGIPFGPFMLAGSWVGIVWGQALMSAYLALFGLG
jgi:leader peptidase (prepilin peptidase)/N-methyltransferase